MQARRAGSVRSDCASTSTVDRPALRRNLPVTAASAPGNLIVFTAAGKPGWNAAPATGNLHAGVVEQGQVVAVRLLRAATSG